MNYYFRYLVFTIHLYPYLQAILSFSLKFLIFLARLAKLLSKYQLIYYLSIFKLSWKDLKSESATREKEIVTIHLWIRTDSTVNQSSAFTEGRKLYQILNKVFLLLKDRVLLNYFQKPASCSTTVKFFDREAKYESLPPQIQFLIYLRIFYFLDHDQFYFDCLWR